MSSVAFARPTSSHANPFAINRWILKSDLPAGAKVLLLVIVDHAGHGRSVCFASHATLAEESGMSPRQVRRLVHELADAGWITIEATAGGTNRLRLADKCFPEVGSPALRVAADVPRVAADVQGRVAVAVPQTSPSSTTQRTNSGSLRSDQIPQNYNPSPPKEPEREPSDVEVLQQVMA